jgi:CubicO group peptidase (beta-lactamase class C family)
MKAQTPSISHRAGAAMLLCVIAVARPATGQVGPPPTAYLDMAQEYTFAKRGQSMVVLFDGSVVREAYANGGGPDRLQFLASATKGFTGMIGAMAANDGIIGLDDSLADVLPEWRTGDPNLSLIRYRHALTMTSGLKEIKGASGWVDYVNQATIIHPAGTVFNYSGDPNVFGAALQRALKSETVEAYMQRRLFQPLGIRVTWQDFTDGNPQLSGGAFVRPAEWARFGEFVRLGGVWQGQRLLSAQYFDQVFKPIAPNPVYGFYWWLKEPITEQEAGQFLEEGHFRRVFPLTLATYVPDDLVMAAGAYEQALYVMPSLKLVVLRNGPQYTQSDRGLLYDDIEFLSRLLRGRPAAAAPAITSSPVTNAVVGEPYAYVVSKTGWPLPTVTATGLPGWLTLTGTTLTGTPASAGTFGPITLTASNGVPPNATRTFSIEVFAADAASGSRARLANLSLRSAAGAGDQALILGFVVAGGSKNLLIRGVGPALTQFGVSGVLANPQLGVYSGGTVLLTNDNWESAQAAEKASAAVGVGAFALPAGGRDADVLPTLGTGAYTAQVSGVGGATGIALLELYDAAGASTARLVNASARTQVGTGANVLIAGFTIAGPAAKTVLIRAVGPTLASFGVAGALADPTLTVLSSRGPLATNDNWSTGSGAAVGQAAGAVGAFALPSGSLDAALLLSLAPGSYTAQVGGVRDTTGVALVEVYDVP